MKAFLYVFFAIVAAAIIVFIGYIFLIERQQDIEKNREITNQSISENIAQILRSLSELSESTTKNKFPEKQYWPKKITINRPLILKSEVSGGIMEIKKAAGTAVELIDIKNDGTAVIKYGSILATIPISDTSFIEAFPYTKPAATSTPAVVTRPAPTTATHSAPAVASVSTPEPSIQPVASTGLSETPTNTSSSPSTASLPTTSEQPPSTITNHKRDTAQNDLELVPYNNLNPHNITLEESTVSTGGSTDRKWESWWGSYSRDTISRRVIEIKIGRIGNSGEPLTLEVFKIFRQNGKETRLFLTGKKEFPFGVGEYQFDITATATHVHYEYDYPRRDYKSGQTIAGWFVRAIRNGAIVGVAASSESYLNMAKSPKEIYGNISEAMETELKQARPKEMRNRGRNIGGY
ncbi:MAG: hypothetical protein ABI443_00290 [Chthoniobacterales bacterium]